MKTIPFLIALLLCPALLAGTLNLTVLGPGGGIADGSITTNKVDSNFHTLLMQASGSEYIAADTVVSNSLSTRLISTNTALIAADTVVSNALSARLISTNSALVTRITDATNSLNTTTGTRLIATNDLLVTRITNATNTLSSVLTTRITDATNSLRTTLVAADTVVSNGLYALIGSGIQTPWAQNIDGDGYSLLDVDQIEVTGSITSPSFSVGSLLSTNVLYLTNATPPTPDPSGAFIWNSNNYALYAISPYATNVIVQLR
jgi:hypothetical protein